ncbi:MAG: adenylate kinase [Clostridia bacterium]|nr:adenylate kinase [Clostridia bacterium]
MRIILLAAPGAGKGTQAEKLSEHFGIPTISTGSILRRNIQEGTELGKLAKKYIDGGNLIPDEVMIQVMQDRLSQPDCEKGFILDGFPRTLPQAEALSASDIDVDVVLNLEVPEEKIIERLSGRVECSKCGATYHIVHNKPEKDGVCDKCGGGLVTRVDDQPETIKSRLDIYHTQTEPLLAYYQEKQMLRTVEGKEEIAETTAAVLNALED